MSVAAPERPRARTERSERSAPVESIPTPTIEEALESTMNMFGPKRLPVFERHDEVTNFISVNKCGIIEGETGSGKSTVSPVLALAIAESNANSDNPARVVVTQPRRLAVESITNYLKPTMGDRVGFRHGNGSSVTENTQLEFVVERSLLNEIVRDGDSLLSKYDTVIIDEVHEGTVDSEILIALLKNIQKARKDTEHPLKLIFTSATMDKQKLIDYFEDSENPMKSIKVEGRMFDVKEHFEEEKVDIRNIEKTAAKKAMEVFLRGDQEPGDMLIFMPGKGEIERTIETLNELQQVNGITQDQIEFVSLMGGNESAEAMRKIYETSTKRRIFVSTNVAETSITIPSVRVVIDSGLMRINVFDPKTGMSGLRTEPTTKSNARQRKGRAGRVAPGTVHYLFTKEEFDSRHDFLQPEILRSDLVTQVLLMKELGIKNIAEFDFLNHPGKTKINQALRTLDLMGALNVDGSLSETGRLMSKESVEPRFARMLVEAEKLGVKQDVALVIGMIQNARFNVVEKGRKITDPEFSRFVAHGSDILTRLNIWNEYVANNSNSTKRKEWEENTKINTFGFFNASRSRQEILNNRNIKDAAIDLSHENMAKIYKCLTVGLVDNVVVNKNGKYQTLSGVAGIKISGDSVLANSRPDTFVSTNLNKTERGDVYAGLNFRMSYDEVKRIIPDIEKTPGNERLNLAETERTIETIATEIEMATTASQFSHSGLESSVHSEKNEEKPERRIDKIRNKIREWLRKLRLIK